MMNRNSILLIIFIFALSLCARFVLAINEGTVIISGKILDPSGIGIRGATVVLVEINKRTTSNENGYFRIENLPVGDYHLRISHIQYETQTMSVEASVPPETQVTVKLTPIVIQIEGVTVKSKRYKQSSIGEKLIGIETLKNTTGALEDVLRAVQTMPGISSASDFASQFFVRGDSSDRNYVLLDGVEAIFPYRLFGMLSMFNPASVKEVKLLPGGFPANYGDKLSSVLIVDTKEGNRDEYEGSLDVSIISTNMNIGGPIPIEQANGSWILSGRRTYYDLILDRFLEENINLPHFYDLQGKIAIQPKTEHKFVFNNFLTKEGMKVIQEDERVGYNWDKSVNSLQWDYAVNENLSATTLLAYNNNFLSVYGKSSDTSAPSSPGFSTDEFMGVDFDTYTLREDVLLKYSDNHEINGGLEFRWTSFRFSLGQDLRGESDFPLSRLPSFTSRDNRYAAYLQDMWKISDNLNSQYGLRLDYSSLTEDAEISPRIHFSLKSIPLTTFGASIGIYYQSPDDRNLLENLLEQVNFNVPNRFFHWKDYPEIKAEKSTHYIIEAEKQLYPGWELEVEMYDKEHRRIILPNDFPTISEFQSDVPSQNYSGFRRGIDVVLEKQRRNGKFAGLLSYSYAVSKDIVDRDQSEYFTVYDRPHSLKVVGDYSLTNKFSIGFNFRIVSGNPYTPVIGFERNRKVEIYGEYNSERIPTYHRLDLRFNYRVNWFGLSMETYLEIMNVYNHKNVFMYDFSPANGNGIRQDAIYMLPIVPTFGIKVTSET